ncbi:MAG: hypothetical protein PHQ11_14410 [Paludibacter sp.]|nr:hypothetical protein [Paludibacter sp.]MDD4199180.1 hypothetical protein [Paludibacter sp.]MDD4428638.1 hypothetical protein [Paludibacter sp.]
MVKTFIISAILLFLGILLLGIRVFFVKGGVFPNIHIGGNKALKNKGIGCATSQDRDAQLSKRQSSNKMVDDMIKNL